MNTNKLTKPQLIERLSAQGAEIATLRAQLSEARTMIEMLRPKNLERPTPREAAPYPLVDKLGRHYRLEGRVKCYQPS